MTGLAGLVFGIVLAGCAPAAWAQIVGSGTTAVAIRTPKELVVAVDSLETWSDYSAGSPAPERHTSVCKMRAIGPYYAVVAGIDRGTGGFDALDAATKAFVPGDSPGDYARRVAERVGAAVLPLLDSVRRASSDDFTRKYSGRPVIDLLIAGAGIREAGSALVEITESSGVNKSGLSSTIRLCPPDCAGRTSIISMGIHGEIDRLLEENPRFLLQPPENLARAFVQMEASSHPDFVGGPISMIRGGKHGMEVLNAGACSGIRGSR